MSVTQEQIIRNFIDNYKRNSTRNDGRIDQCIEHLEYLLKENFRLITKKEQYNGQILQGSYTHTRRME